MAAAAGGLPHVPLSPLTKASIACANALAHAHEKLSEAKLAKPPVTVDILRRLIEDTRVEQGRMDQLTRQIKSVQAATAFNWDPDLLARQIAVIDCQLFDLAILQRKWLCQLDMRQTKLVHLLDFHHYLTHAFAHQLIYWSELAQNNAQVQVVPPVHPKDNLITHIVRIAFLLVHAYRDFSGFAAVMRALGLPEVQRLRRLWQSCPSRTKDMYRELALIVSPAQNYKAYHDLLYSKVSVFHHLSLRATGVTIAIPWLKPHLASIRAIITAYAAGNHDEGSSVLEAGEVILSAPGARKLSALMAVLELCQQNSTTESPDLLDDLSNKGTSKRTSMMTKPIQLDGLRAAVAPVADLSRLAPGDVLAHHWLVSRVYLTRDQLITESTEVEPLSPGEELVCDAAEHDHLLDRATVHESLAAAAARVPSEPASRRDSMPPPQSPDLPQPRMETRVRAEEEEETNNPAEQVAPSTDKESDDDHDDDDEQDNHDQQDGGEAQRTDARQLDTAEPAEPSDPTAPAIAIAVEKATTTSHSTPDTDNDHTPTTADKVERAPDMDLQKVPSKESHTKDKDAAHQREKSLTGQSLMTISTHHDSTTTKLAKSRLSPTAPVFIPSAKSTPQLPTLDPDVHVNRAGTENMSLSVVVSLPSSLQDVRRLVPFGPAKYADQDAGEDADEEWRGYSAHKSAHEPSQPGDAESERWTGYPSPSSKVDDEDEAWKGYPGPEDTTDSTQGSPRRQSSQSEESEGWKGYRAAKIEEAWQQETKLKVQEHDWQGYALETLNEDELDSSTMMDGEFGKSRQAMRRTSKGDPMEAFRRNNLYKR